MSNDDATWTDHRDELFERVVHRGRARKRRRALVTIGVVVIVGAGAAFGLYSPSRGHDTLHVANDPNQATTTTLPTRPGGVFLIGDAVMLGAKSALEQAIPEARIDAGVSRQLDHAIPILDAAKREGPLPPTIVIGLGTNGPSEGTFDTISRDVKQIMGVAGPDTTVFFLTVKVPRAWEGEVNDALYSEASLWPNAYVLAWHDYAQSHPDWFVSDGFHLNVVGQVAYAAFIRDAVSQWFATSTDLFAGRTIPSSGFVVADDAKSTGYQGPTSFTMELFDDAGHSLVTLPRATIDDAALNAEQHVLVVTDNGIRVQAEPFEDGIGLPTGCMQTESDQELAVALCGTGSGINLLGQRIVVNRGKGWTQIIGLPPVQGGSPLVGHWAWASPAPNGQWVLGGWSAECEVPMGLFVSTADGSVHAVTGEAGTAWRDAPESETFGWAPDGAAIVGFGGSSDCGGSARPTRRLPRVTGHRFAAPAASAHVIATSVPLDRGR